MSDFIEFDGVVVEKSQVPSASRTKPNVPEKEADEDVRAYNIGSSNYATKKIQPWDIWLEYGLNPWDADIIKRVLRTKEGEDPLERYEKIIHVAKERIRQIKSNTR